MKSNWSIQKLETDMNRLYYGHRDDPDYRELFEQVVTEIPPTKFYTEPVNSPANPV